MVSAERDIHESLRILLSTRPGERVMHPDYGCGIHGLVFEVLNGATIARIEASVRQAILFFEPRVDFESMDVDPGEALEGVLRLRIEYRVRETNSRRNIVYDFYLREGTSVGSFASPDPTR